MANSLTNRGEEMALIGNGSNNGSIARLAATVRLYTGASEPAKDGALGVDFIEVANGNGYVTGGLAITTADWTLGLVAGNRRITLTNKVWTAVGGQILSIGGAFLCNAAGEPLAWWERPSATNLDVGDSLTLDGLFIELN